MKNETIDAKLEKQLYSRINETGEIPTLIVMHPHTWYEMKISDFDSFDRVFYKGVKVLRSSDVPVGLFEVR